MKRDSSKRVLFLIESLHAPAPRFRVMQFINHLEANGFECVVRACHSQKSARLFGIPVLGSMVKLMERVLRLRQLQDVAEFDVVFLQRPTLYFSSYIERQIIKRNPNLIFDFDDAVYCKETGPSKIRRAVFKNIVGISKVCIAGCSNLAKETGRTDTVVIPTVVDTHRFKPRNASMPNGICIGWTGTSSNYHNLYAIRHALERILNTYPRTSLLIIGDTPIDLDLPRTCFQKWTEDSEIELLQRFDIGLMPLEDTEWNRGKCAFKIVQYLAVGIPVVSSAVGTNVEIMNDQRFGELVNQRDNWFAALGRVVENVEQNRYSTVDIRRHCEENYSVDAQSGKLTTVINGVSNV